MYSAADYRTARLALSDPETSPEDRAELEQVVSSYERKWGKQDDSDRQLGLVGANIADETRNAQTRHEPVGETPSFRSAPLSSVVAPLAGDAPAPTEHSDASAVNKYLTEDETFLEGLRAKQDVEQAFTDPSSPTLSKLKLPGFGADSLPPEYKPADAKNPAEGFEEPTVDEFRQAMRPSLGKTVDTLDENSIEYRVYADQSYKRALARSMTTRTPLTRLSQVSGGTTAAIAGPLSALRGGFVHGASWGADEPLTAGLEDEDTTYANSTEGHRRLAGNHPIASGIGAAAGALMPWAPFSLASSWIGEALPAGGGALGGLARGAVSGGAGMAVQGASEDVATGLTEAARGNPETADAALRNTYQSALPRFELGAGLGLGGEALGAFGRKTEQAMGRTREAVAEDISQPLLKQAYSQQSSAVAPIAQDEARYLKEFGDRAVPVQNLGDALFQETQRAVVQGKALPSPTATRNARTIRELFPLTYDVGATFDDVASAQRALRAQGSGRIVTGEELRSMGLDDVAEEIGDNTTVLLKPRELTPAQMQEVDNLLARDAKLQTEGEPNPLFQRLHRAALMDRDQLPSPEWIKQKYSYSVDGHQLTGYSALKAAEHEAMGQVERSNKLIGLPETIGTKNVVPVDLGRDVEQRIGRGELQQALSRQSSGMRNTGGSYAESKRPVELHIQNVYDNRIAQEVPNQLFIQDGRHRLTMAMRSGADSVPAILRRYDEGGNLLETTEQRISLKGGAPQAPKTPALNVDQDTAFQRRLAGHGKSGELPMVQREIQRVAKQAAEADPQVGKLLKELEGVTLPEAIRYLEHFWLTRPFGMGMHGFGKFVAPKLGQIRPGAGGVLGELGESPGYSQASPEQAELVREILKAKQTGNPVHLQNAEKLMRGGSKLGPGPLEPPTSLRSEPRDTEEAGIGEPTQPMEVERMPEGPRGRLHRGLLKAVRPDAYQRHQGTPEQYATPPSHETEIGSHKVIHERNIQHRLDEVWKDSGGQGERPDVSPEANWNIDKPEHVTYFLARLNGRSDGSRDGNIAAAKELLSGHSPGFIADFLNEATGSQLTSRDISQTLSPVERRRMAL